MKSVRLSITIPDVLLTEIDKFADEHDFTRSTLLQVAVAQYMRAENMMPSVQEAFALMGSLAKRSASDGVDSAEYEKELQQLESINGKLQQPFFQSAAPDEPPPPQKVIRGSARRGKGWYL